MAKTPKKLRKKTPYRDASGRFATRPAPAKRAVAPRAEPVRARYYWKKTGEWYYGDTWAPAPRYRWDKVRRDSLGRALDDSGVRIPESAVAGKPPVKKPAKKKRPKPVQPKPTRPKPVRPKPVRPKPKPKPKLEPASIRRLRAELKREQELAAEEAAQAARAKAEILAEIATLKAKRAEEKKAADEAFKRYEAERAQFEADAAYHKSLPTLYTGYKVGGIPGNIPDSSNVTHARKPLATTEDMSEVFEGLAESYRSRGALSNVYDMTFSQWGFTINPKDMSQEWLDGLRRYLEGYGDRGVGMVARALRFESDGQVLVSFNPPPFRLTDYGVVMDDYLEIIPEVQALMLEYDESLDFTVFFSEDGSDYEGSPAGLPA